MKGLSQEDHTENYSREGLFWGITPNKYVSKMEDYISTPANILDLGAGEGRNSVFLAKLGFMVTAVDINKTALDKIRKASDGNDLDIQCELIDIAGYDISEEYDAVISTAALYFIAASDLTKVIRNIQTHTKNNGINLLTLFSTDDPGVSETPYYYFFSENELREYYKDWHIELLEHYQKHETHGAPHDHDFLALIARKK